jgi:hypothetical protein
VKSPVQFGAVMKSWPTPRFQEMEDKLAKLEKKMDQKVSIASFVIYLECVSVEIRFHCVIGLRRIQICK